MSESMKNLKKSHKCAEITEILVGQEVTIMGWLNKKRNFKQHTFITIRDVSGIVQAVFDETVISKEMLAKVDSVKGEFVVAVRGLVKLRTDENINPDMITGKVEIEPTEFRILSESEQPPFTPLDVGVKEDMRLKYRYIDLRRKEIQQNLILRHNTAQSVRNFYNKEGFYEIETPILTKSTPEGARDYLVPSRVYPGNFYALPQSPQILKQILMISGMDRYYQIVKCFRDEDLRADRQPEFTQIDIELSFVDIDDVIDINERLIKTVFSEVLNYNVSLPIKRITYDEAMEKYGSDKPDLRFGMELVNITSIVKGSEFIVFENAINEGGSVRGINAKSLGNIPRKQIDSLVDMAKSYGAKGLSYIIVNENDEYKTSLSKFLNEEMIEKIVKAFDGQNGDLILLASDKNKIVFDALGAIRNECAKRLNLISKDQFSFVWITHFPLFEWSEEDNRFYAAHHPFTSPMEEDIPFLDSDPAKVRARAYDLAINGYEIGGGSIRIHQRDLQEKMFNVLGFSNEEANNKFGYLLEAFKYGAPPHGGLAFGLDRLVMILTGADNIREVIAFPKTKDASCLLSDAPNVVSDAQLKELGIKIEKYVERNEK